MTVRRYAIGIVLLAVAVVACGAPSVSIRPSAESTESSGTTADEVPPSDSPSPTPSPTATDGPAQPPDPEPSATPWMLLDGSHEWASDSMSADGTYTAFWSDGKLTPDDEPGTDIFVENNRDDTLTRVPLEIGGQRLQTPATPSQELSMAADGRSIAFTATCAQPGMVCGQQIYAYNLDTKVMVRVSVTSSGQIPEGHSQNPDISSDGRYVAFVSWAPDVTANPCPSGACDSQIYLRDLVAKTTELISVAPDGSQGNKQSYDPYIPAADGDAVRFASEASNLKDPTVAATYGSDGCLVFERRRATGKTVCVDPHE